jgi:hypothetical protein
MRPQPDTERVTKTLCESCAPYRRNLSTGGGNRTHTGLPPEDFKSSASAIPPRRQDSLSSKAVDRQSKSRQLDLILASRQHASKAGQGARTFVAGGVASRENGGGGIRTHGRLSPTTVFKTVPIDHSGTPPLAVEHSRRGTHTWSDSLPRLAELVAERALTGRRSPRPKYRRRRRSEHPPSPPARSHHSAASRPRPTLPRAGCAAWRNTCAHVTR